MILSAIFGLLAAVAPGEADVALLDGTSFVGRVTEWDADRVVLETPAGPQSIDRERLLAINVKQAGEAATRSGLEVEFVDGTSIAISEYTAAGRAAAITTPYAESVLRVPREIVRVAWLQPPTEALRNQWAEVDRSELAGDVLLVVQRDGEAADYLAGVVGDVTADVVAFEWDGQQLDVKRAKVAAIRYFSASQRRLPEAICTLALADGSQIAVREISFDGKQTLRLRTPGGARLAVPLSAAARADYSAGKLAYLSDLTPAESAWTPRIAMPAAADIVAEYGRPRNDVSFGGSALALAWENDALPAGREIRTYTKGVALRSRTELTYRMPPGMRRFAAIAGIDPATTSQGHVVLEIRADDRVVWEGEVDGKRPPVAIEVDLGTARRLQIRVDYGRNLDYGDRLHLADARVTK